MELHTEQFAYSHAGTLILEHTETKLCFAIELNSSLGKGNTKKTENCQKAK